MKSRSKTLEEIPNRRAGFSLVEVVLAVGIFSFALVSILYLFGGLLDNASALSKRREALAMSESLRNYLNFRSATNSARDWSNAYQILADGTNANLYGRATKWNWTNNSADANSRDVTFHWTTNVSDLAAQEDARSGPLYRVKLELAPNNATNALPTSASAYPFPLVIARASFYAVGQTGGSLPANSTPSASAVIPVIR
jgi:Tfp pilus assembly protein PilV